MNGEYSCTSNFESLWLVWQRNIQGHGSGFRFCKSFDSQFHLLYTVRSSSLFSCPGSSIPDLRQWVSGSVGQCHFRISTQRVTVETSDPSDIWSEWYLDKKTEKQKDKKTKRQKDKKTKRHKDTKTRNINQISHKIFNREISNQTNLNQISHTTFNNEISKHTN